MYVKRSIPARDGNDGVIISMELALITQAYDAHMNLVLGQVEEAIHVVDVSEDGQPSPPRVSP